MRPIIALLFVLCGCAGEKPPGGDRFAAIEDPTRTFETSTTGNSGFCRALETEGRATEENCENLAQNIIRGCKAKKKIDYVKVYVSQATVSTPCFRFVWSRPKDADTGEYEKYVIEQNEYDIK